LLFKNVTRYRYNYEKRRDVITSPLFKKRNYNSNGVTSNALLSNPDLYHTSKQALSLVSTMLEIGRETIDQSH